MIVTNNSSGNISATVTRYYEPTRDMDDFGRCVKYRRCDFCGTPTELNYRKYCSYRCTNDAQIARRRERLEEQRKKHCQHCNCAFDAKRTDQKYCSTNCRVAAKRLRDTEVAAND